MSVPGKRILITGAAGFIGSACARRFLSRGWHVTALVHLRAPEGLEGAGTIHGSLWAPVALNDALDRQGPFDVVLNCAGVASDVARVKNLMQVNYRGAQNLARWLARQEQGRLVHISTTDVYGMRDFADADESAPLQDNLRQGYPASKILAEQAIKSILPPDRYVLLRPGAVCGPGDRTLLPRVLGFLRSSPVIVHFGRWRGKNRWPLAHVNNLATAAFLAATCDEALGQAYNVVDPNSVTIEQYYQRVIEELLPHKTGMKSICLPLSAWWPFGYASSLLSRAIGNGRPVLDPSLYALHSIAANLDFSSHKLQQLFAAHDEHFVDSFEGLDQFVPVARA